MSRTKNMVLCQMPMKNPFKTLPTTSTNFKISFFHKYFSDFIFPWKWGRTLKSQCKCHNHSKERMEIIIIKGETGMRMILGSSMNLLFPYIDILNEAIEYSNCCTMGIFMRWIASSYQSASCLTLAPSGLECIGQVWEALKPK